MTLLLIGFLIGVITMWLLFAKHRRICKRIGQDTIALERELRAANAVLRTQVKFLASKLDKSEQELAIASAGIRAYAELP